MIPCHQPTLERNALIAKIAVPKKQEVGLGLTLAAVTHRNSTIRILLCLVYRKTLQIRLRSLPPSGAV